ncbi:MAG: adenylate/guanylate cyclase domain-containing protein, partial [Chloroflexota bacterium]
MEHPEAYIPMNRRHALARGEDLSERTEGAALFADISGFTPLTAALLKELGLKRGSEELASQLNVVYDALVNEVHRYGGSILNFSGDAITCWLDNDDGTQAVACAVALQAVMDQFDSMETPAGSTISLGLKVAVVTGPIRRFQIGDPRIQLLDTMTGGTLERMADAEAQAERGDIIVGPEVVEAIGDLLEIGEYRTDSETGAQFARITGLTQEIDPTPWPSLPTTLTETQMRPWSLAPVYDRLMGGAGEFLAEIRPSVALFLRFDGIDYDSDPQAGAKLDAYVRWVQSILLTYESYLLQLTIGDKGCYLYSSFGSPNLHDDDPARAVAAALDLQAIPDELSYIGPVQIGISQGRMRSGAYGGIKRRTYGSLGDEVNMAARLMGKANPGQILASQRVADAVEDIYELESLGLIKVKGKEEPIPVASILGRRQQARPRAVNLYPTPLVGRDQELSEMEQILATAEAGQSGHILRVEGVAGVGKSHLMAEFAQQTILFGWRVVLGACH